MVKFPQKGKRFFAALLGILLILSQFGGLNTQVFAEENEAVQEASEAVEQENPAAEEDTDPAGDGETVAPADEDPAADAGDAEITEPEDDPDEDADAPDQPADVPEDDAEGDVDVAEEEDPAPAEEEAPKNRGSPAKAEAEEDEIEMLADDEPELLADIPGTTGSKTVLAFTSDVHNNDANAARNRMNNWLTNVIATNKYEGIDVFGFCGDMGHLNLNGDSFWTAVNNVMTAVDAAGIDGVYTTGNHEYYNGQFGTTSNSVKSKYLIDQKGYEGRNFIIYCLGSQANSDNYTSNQINALKSFLNGVGNDKVIIFITHFPLHRYSNRTTTNADQVIDALNDAVASGKKIVMLWGHNHSMSDPNYDQVFDPADSITYASGKSKDIDFFYAAAGCMSDSEYPGSSSVMGKGLILTIDSSNENQLSFTYYNESGENVTEDGTYTEKIGDDPSGDDPEPAAENEEVNITPTTDDPEESVSIAVGDTLTINVTNDGRSTYTFTATLTNSNVAEFQGSNSVSIDSQSTGQLTVKGLAAGTVDINFSNNSTYGDQYSRKATIHLTVGDGSTPVDPGEGTRYELASELEDGGEYLIVNTSIAGAGYALKNPGGSANGTSIANSANKTAVTIVDDYIETEDTDIVWTATAVEGGFELTNDGDYIEGASGNVLVFNPQKYPGRYWTYNTDKYLQHKGGQSTYTIRYSSSNKYFQGSTSQTNAVYLFKKVSGEQVAVTGVTVTPTEKALEVGETVQLTKTIEPSNASNKNVTWSSSNASVATVSNTGLVTAVAGGTATITVTTVDGEKTATCTVTVTEPEPVRYIEVSALQEGKEYIVAVTKDANTVYVIRNNGGSLASADLAVISENGNKFIDTARTDVVWKYNGGTDNYLTNQTSYYLNITNSGNARDLYISTTSAYGVGYTDSHMYLRYFSQSTSEYYVVCNNGTFSAGAKNDSSNAATIRLFEEYDGTTPTVVDVTGVTLDKETLALNVGETGNLTATVAPSNATNKNVTWSSSDETVATVNNGVVTAVAAGTTTITVTTEDGNKTATCTVTVTSSTPGVEKTYVPADTLVDGKSYLIVNGNTGSVYVLGNEATGSGDGAGLKGISATVVDGKITLSATDAAKAEFTAEIKTSDSGAVSAWLKNVNGYLYTASRNGFRVSAEQTDSANTGKFWHYKADGKNLLWYFKDTASSDGYTDTSSTYKYYLSCSTGTYTAEHVTSTSLENTNTPAIYLFVDEDQAVGVSNIVLDKTTATLEAGQTLQLNATITPEGATYQGLTWTSSNTAVATVEGGLVTAVTEGTATITVTSASGKTATCTVTVTAPVIYRYVKVDELEAGGEYIITNNADVGADTTRALKNPGGTSGGVTISSSNGKTNVTILEGNVIETSDTNIVWTATANGTTGGFYLTNNGDYLEVHQQALKVFSSEPKQPTRYWTYNVDDDTNEQQLRHKGGNSTYALYYNSSSTFAASSSTTNKVYLFKKVDDSAHEHTYGTPTYTWATGNASCTATATCSGCEEGTEGHTVTETVTASYAVTTPATCTAVGSGTYTANFTNALFTQQTQTVEIPKIDHSLDHHAAVAATCTTAGNIEYWQCSVCEKYFSDAAGSNEITQAQTVVAIDENAHNWDLDENNVSWAWTGTTAATATFKCINDASHTHPESAVITSAQGTGENVGYTVYTATVTFNGHTYTDTDRVINQYTIAYDLDGGTVATDNPTSYTIESNAITLTNPTKTGYTFAGWTGTGLSAATQTVTIAKGSTGDRSYTATWTANTYTVKFDKNNTAATGTMADQSFTYGEKKALTANAFTRANYTFAGWAETANGGVKYQDEEEVENLTSVDGATVTLYAVWTQDAQVTVTFKAKGGIGADKTQTIYANVATALDKNTFTRTGYTFSSWNTKADGTGTSYADEASVTLDANTELFAQWTPQNYTISYELDGGTVATANPTSYTIESNAITLNNPTKTGYTFAGWTGTGITGAAQTVTIAKGSTGDRAYTATWTAHTYTVKFEKNAENVSGSMADQSFTYGEKKALTANAFTKANYTFQGWAKTASGEVEYADQAEVENLTAENNATVTLYAVWEEDAKVTVTFKANGGTGTDKTQEIYKGVATALDKNTFTRAGHTFSGWNTKADGTGTAYADEAVVTLNANTELYAQWTINKYTVTFVDEDGTTVLKAATEYDYGTPAAEIAKPTDPTKEGNAQYTYTFAGWTPEIKDVTGNATYKATYSSTINKYTITFVDDDDTILKAATEYEYGTPAAEIAKPTDPTKDATAQYTYTFTGWTPQIADVTGNATYKATYTSTVNTYKVTFVGEDGTTVLKEATYPYGTAAADIEKPADPTKAETAQYTYTFAGWTPAIAEVTKDATYKATFNETLRKYTVTFVDEDGTTVLKAAAEYDYGTTAANIAKPEDPTKAATAQYTYTFAGWSPEIANVTANATYKATYTSTVNKYTITWKNGDTVLETDENVEYGTIPTYDGAEPTKEGDAQHTYAFAGWSPAPAEVTGDATYTATFTEDTNSYTVTWFNSDGTELEKDEDVAYGATPSYDGAEPTKAADAEFTYTFAGWTPEVATVTGNAQYTATYTQVRNKYKVTFVDEDGTTVLSEAEYEYGTAAADIVKPEDPTKPATGENTYTFAGWTPEIVAVTAAATYTATYTSTTNVYTIKFVNDDGTVLQNTQVTYGTTPAYQGETPTKAADGDFIYTFDKWTPEIVAATADATYTASYTTTARTYGEPEWSWTGSDAAGYTAATATFTTTDDGAEVKQEVKDEQLTSATTAATCEEAGKTVYTAEVTFKDETYTITKEVTLPAIGHDWDVEKIKWNWTPTETGYTATATLTCKNDPSHTKVENATIAEETIGETTTYTATVTIDGVAYSATKKEGTTVTYELDQHELTIPVGDGDKLTLEGSDGSIGHGTWKSSDEKIATVDKNGFVTAKKYGKVTITVTMEDGFEDSCEVQTLFWDVANPKDYFFKAVYWGADHEPAITKGYDLEYFGVGQGCTRQEFILFIYRLAGEPSVSSAELKAMDQKFSDTKNLKTSFRKAIAWGVKKGIINGYTTGALAGTFGPERTVTRREAVLMLWRYAGKPAAEENDLFKSFTDVAGKFKKTTDTYNSIKWAASTGISKGYSKQKDIPANDFGYTAPCYGCDLECLREAMIVFLYRFATM